MRIIKPLISLSFLGIFFITAGEPGFHDGTWDKIKPFFNPPSEFQNNYGSYRSPLVFYDGRKVESPEDWLPRRQEILDKWHRMMGEWPPLIERPEIEIVQKEKRENFFQYQILFEWRQNEKTHAYLLIPDTRGRKPAVVTVYYEPETAIGLKTELRDFAYHLAKRGFVALSIGTSAIKDTEPYAQYYPTPENASIQPLSMLAYLAANAHNLLSGLPDVDPSRIGIAGHSYGGKWAMFASCLYEKFACAAWSDGGIVFDESRPNVNYWEPWYLGYHKPPWRKRGMVSAENPARGLYAELVKNDHDLHELHALMAPRPFLVSGGSEDPVERWIPLNHTVAVNRLLGYSDRVAMTNRPSHAPTPESNEQMYLFFEHFLK
jgi:dienelactone hydrolase